VSDPLAALIIELIEWIGPQRRPYAEVIEAWRTSCPRLSVWEEATARGFVVREYIEGIGSCVSVSPSGRSFLARHRRRRPDPARTGPVIHPIPESAGPAADDRG
jgi:hypothetical protein